jgi:hypothetical protein
MLGYRNALKDRALGPAALNRLADYGWIERRGGGSRSEIKLTPAGLAALQTPI